MWAKLAKAVVALLPRDVKEKVINGGKAILITIFFAPVLILLVLFNPSSSSEEPDIYSVQLKQMGCGQHDFYLDEVRLYEHYLTMFSNQNYTMSDPDQIKERLRNIYFEKSLFGCAMRDDGTILEILNQDYKLPVKYNEDLLEDLNQLRFKREKVLPPLKMIAVRQNYSVLGLDGVELETSSRATVLASLSGIVDSIEYLDEEIELEVECPPLTEEEIEAGEEEPEYCSIFVPLGKTVKLQHEFTTGITDDANYKQETIYTSYSHMGNVEVNVGQEINRGDILGKIEDDLMFFRMKKEDGTIMNPEDYIYLYTKMSSETKAELEGMDIQLPLKTAYSVSAGFGLYDPFGDGGTMHYGVDLAGKRNDPIYSATTGKVIKVFYDSIGGNQLWIQSGNYTFVYAHMNRKAIVDVGDTVSIGTQVGYMGDTGKVTGVHLHFEIRDSSGTSLDPSEILEF